MSTQPNVALLVESKAVLAVRQVSAHERISRPFVIDVLARSRQPFVVDGSELEVMGAAIDLEAIVGKPASVRVQQDDGKTKVWSGVCAQVEQVRFDETVGAESTYQLRIVPQLWLLSHRRSHRIFQHKTIPDIVTEILIEWHVDCELRLDMAAYPVQEYCVQYGETDLAFFHRLLEEAGIVYFFDDSSGSSLLVLSDQAHAAAKSLELPYASNPNEVHGTVYATRVHLAHQVRPGLVTISDYNFRNPKAPMVAKSDQIPGPEGSREIFEYTPGAFLMETGGPGQGPADEKVADDKSTTIHDPEKAGEPMAQRFLEAERHKRRYVSFESSAQNLAAGQVICINDHPQKELSGKSLLVIEVMDHLNASGDWQAVAEAVFADGPYRSPRVTPKPRVAGVQSAIVVGPKGEKEEIYTDEFGRVRVHFHWDREGDFDDHSTCWLRVSQGWGGAQYGVMFIPRIGHEVIVDFEDGDPDRPVVVGRVYTQPSPAAYSLPKHKTRSSWQTNTTPSDAKSKNFNEIMLEDAADNELVFVQAERNYMRLTKRNETERTGEDRLSVVGDHRLGIVGEVDSVHAGKQHLVKMVEVKDLKILKMEDPKTKPQDTWVEVVEKKITLTTGKATVVLEGDSIAVEAKKGIRLSADKNFVIKGGQVFLNAQGAKGVDADADKKAKDEVYVPEGRVVNSILKLFADEYHAKELAGRDALVHRVINGYPATRDHKLTEVVGKPVYVPDDPAKLHADHAETRAAIQAKIGDINVGDRSAAREWENTATTTEQLHNTALATEPMLKDIVGQSADAVDAEAYFGPEGKFAVKGKESLERKVKKGTAVEDVSDAVRGTIIVDRPEQIPGAVKALQEATEASGGQLVVDNKFAKFNDAGYGAVHADLFLKAPNGEMIRSEVQVHVRSLHDGTEKSIKEQSHKIYEKTRDKNVGLSNQQKESADQASMLLWQGGMAPHGG
ncbi:MAG: type VI secretion system tip protein VgrG [Deltaproteobacteria bacterium]|jgi:type VI secretion system secreted protein VgrG|nr:type VI secretion system tip protein VgrG [Deltaproteobacteria bacterium]MBW2531557.1 type VI secretion system tip protein VgrG [Deltaproteobacteria bacterium]